MAFVFSMAWRDSRRARRRLFLFSLSIVLGIAALVAIGSFTDNLRQAIEEQSKTLLGADIAVNSRAPLPPEVRNEMKAFAADQAEEVSFASMALFPSSAQQTRLVSVRAIAGSYPFYGDAETLPSGRLQEIELNPKSDSALLDETLLDQFGLKVGDPIKLGEFTFRVAGALRKMPGESTAVANLSPRVYISLSRLSETKLVVSGSLVRYRTYLRTAANRDVHLWIEGLRKRFGSLRLGFDTVEDRKRELGQSLKNVYAFLSLVGFVSLFLGGIGVASSISIYIREKVSTVAILRCLGASARQSFSVYLVQGLAVGLIGAAVGAALGIAVQLVIPVVVKDFLPFQVSFFISWSAVGRGMAAGVLICLIFCLIPLLGLRKVSPLLALRSGLAETPARFDFWSWTLYGLIVASVIGFAIAQTGSRRIGLGFGLGLLVTLGILAAVARGLAWIARRIASHRWPYVWRQGIANLHRPSNRTVLLLVSLGLGTFLLVVLALSRETLLAQIGGRAAGDRPNLLFFDIQDDQIGPLAALLGQEKAPLRAQAPIVTMRLSAWKGRPIQQVMDDPGLHIPGWTLRREYRSTFRDRLAETEKITAGKWVSSIQSGTTPVPVSVEEGLAKDMQLKVGDLLVWDVQGVAIPSVVASLRTVDWQRLQPNFFVVFPAGVLESAPKMFVVATRAADPAASARLQQRVVQQFSNISAIDLQVILQTLDSIFSKVEFVVRFMALFTLTTGVIVLIGAVFTGRIQRLRESVLLRTLGASRKQLLQIQLVEYAVLGFLAALTGGGLAYAGNALLAAFVFHVPVVAPPLILLWSSLGVTAVTLATGALANRGIAAQSPLEVLRQET